MMAGLYEAAQGHLRQAPEHILWDQRLDGCGSTNV